VGSEIDATAVRLASRLPSLTRTATAVRVAAAARRVRLHAVRADAGTYRGAPVASRFAALGHRADRQTPDCPRSAAQFSGTAGHAAG
jgi:hypothetical protein